jgi:hypothetical protein
LDFEGEVEKTDELVMSWLVVLVLKTRATIEIAGNAAGIAATKMPDWQIKKLVALANKRSHDLNPD